MPSKAATMNAAFLAQVDEKLKKHAAEQASENLKGPPSDAMKDVPQKNENPSHGEHGERDQECILPILTGASYLLLPAKI